MNYLISNLNNNSFFKALDRCACDSDCIKIAVAYLSEINLIKKWINSNKHIELFVSLQLPTNPNALRQLIKLDSSKINLLYVPTRFHSKCYLFVENRVPKYAFVGSSNLTNGGLIKNIETNVLLDRDPYLTEISNQLNMLATISQELSPEDIRKYERYYNKNKTKWFGIEKSQNKFARRTIRRSRRPRIVKPCKKARDYFRFWKRVDEVAELVKSTSKKEWPAIPIYLTLDHFWHWIKVVWDRRNIRRIHADIDYRNSVIPQLFREFVNYDKNGNNYTRKMLKISNKLKDITGKDKIFKMDKPKAKDLYRSLHSGGMRATRFYADKKFVKTNSITKIRSSLNYLLWSNDDVATKIHRLIHDGNFRLHQFGSSNIQELIGWINPEKMPLRNNKADDAVELLGYRFK